VHEHSVISVAHVTKSYGSLVAVDDLSFSVEEATCFALLGPNGAGKTTMMKILYGKARPDKSAGMRIDVFGHDPRTHELEIKSMTGVAPQDDDLDEELSVLQNLTIFARLYNLPKHAARERIDFLLEFMELTQKKESRIRELSGGMRRRLIIARALLADPKLLILDEPTTGLDPQVRQLIWDKMRGLKKEGVTILLTTHYMEEAFQIADRVTIMDHGRKLMEGNPRELLETEIEGHVLEILDKNAVSRLVRSESDRVRMEEAEARVLFYSSERETLRRMAEGLGHGEYYLRTANLEDLFLRATGRGLNAGQ